MAEKSLGDHIKYPSNGDVISIWNKSGSAEHLMKNLAAEFPQLIWEDCDKYVMNTKISRLHAKKKAFHKNHKNKLINELLDSSFELPYKTCPQTVSDTDDPYTSVQKQFDNIKQKTLQVTSENHVLKREIETVEAENEILTHQIQHGERKLEVIENLMEITNEKYKNACHYERESKTLQKALDGFEKRYNTLSAQFADIVDELQEKNDKLQRQSTRNLNKKIKRRDDALEKKDTLLGEKDTLIGEKESEIGMLKGVNESKERKIDDIRKEKKNALSRLSKLKEKNTHDFYEENLKEIENLKLTISAKDAKIKQLHEINALISDNVIESFYDGKFTNEVRETVMTLVTECGVSQKKVNQVMSTVIKNLTGKTLSRLPSTGVKSRLMLEAKRVANQQVAMAMIDDSKQFTLHQDGTSKFHRHFQSFQVTGSDGVSLSAGLVEVGKADASTLFDTFCTLLGDLASTIKEGQQTENIAKLVSNIIATMSDQGSVNFVFNEKFKTFREELLPLVYENWDNFDPEQQQNLGRLFSFFCKMHTFVNMATETDKCLAEFERTVIAEGRNPYAFNSSESGISRLVRTVSKALTDRGCEKSGVGGHFQTYLQEKGLKNELLTFRGHRFNHLYHAAGCAYYHSADVRDFLAKWANPNELLKSICFDIHEPVNVAGIRALGLIDKVVTGPFWRLIESVPNALSLNIHLHQMKIQLESWCKDASPVLAGECMFSEEVASITKDCVYESLIAPVEDPAIEAYTQMALEICFGAMLLILERQAKDQLPGGRYWHLSEGTSKILSAVPTTNTISERDFAQLDMLMRSKPSASTVTYESVIMWTNNKTSAWLNTLSHDDHSDIITEARTHAPQMLKLLKEKQQNLFRTKLELLRIRQEKKVKQEEKQHANKVKLTQKITECGGLWTTSTEIDTYRLDVNDEHRFKESLIAQLQFRKSVLGSSGPKQLFQQQHQGKNYTVNELVNNLAEILVLNAEEDISEKTENKLVYKTKEQVETDIIQLKKSLGSKIEENRKKVCVQQQKEMLPIFLEDPTKLIGKRIKHKCRDPDTRIVERFSGVVLSIKKADKKVNKTEFNVQYDEDDESWHFPLLKDMENGDLIIVH